jgi:hypothetical protein
LINDEEKRDIMEKVFVAVNVGRNGQKIHLSDAVIGQKETKFGNGQVKISEVYQYVGVYCGSARFGSYSWVTAEVGERFEVDSLYEDGWFKRREEAKALYAETFGVQFCEKCAK